jgi:predicted dinucleotide-binding enzyme
VRIAIIGTGNVGSALARACLAAGHDVVLSSRHPEHAAQIAGDLGARAAASNGEAVDGADLVALAIPSRAVASVVDELTGQVEGKIVVDPTNPVDADVNILHATGSVAEGIRLVVPEARVVGFRPLDLGDLGMARALELMAYVNITLNARNGWPWRSGWKLLGPAG